MTPIIEINNMRGRLALQPTTRVSHWKDAKNNRAGWNQYTAKRVVDAFSVCGLSVERLAARERMRRMDVQQILREALMCKEAA